MCLFSFTVQAQLGFCTGNSGDPIFTEDFGAGLTNGPPLMPGVTSYTYSNNQPNDGLYTISSNTAYFDWFDTYDHTPGDTNGKAFIVNASYTPGEFFKREVSGLCENTSYEFSSWLLNLHPAPGCGGNGIPVNVKFEIWDSTDTNLLASGDTGNIYDKNSPVWEQYALVFQTLTGQTSVILKMLNNGAGGCGNDLAIDDIVFKTCGDYIELTDSEANNHLVICEDNTPISTVLTAKPDFSVYNSHAYQWQQSLDGIVWHDIVGETNQSYATPNLLSSHFYRVKVAEDVVNLNNSLCNTLSEVFDIIIVSKPIPPITEFINVTLCPNQNEAIYATAEENVHINWYDAPIGGTLLAENSYSFIPNSPGTYYAEAMSDLVDCTANARVSITVDFYPQLMTPDEDLMFCKGTTITLDAGLIGMEYIWNTGDSSYEIIVNTPGEYSVEITNSSGCRTTKKINLIQLETPVLNYITSDDYTLEIFTSNSGDFEYSLDGVEFQSSSVFPDTPGALYTIYIREANGCGTVPTDYIHLVIPKFFSPNGDGVNDEFKAEGIEAYGDYHIQIFDRFGRLLKQTQNAHFSWDGQFNNSDLPSSDYWYVIKYDSNVLKGHFSLKR